MNFTKLSAALAGLSLISGTAFAQSEPVQTQEMPNIIILEMQPSQPGEGETADVPGIPDQLLVEMLLMQLFPGLQIEPDDQQELQIVRPRTEPGTGI